MEQKFITPKQAAKSLGVHARTVARYARQKQIPSVKIGRSIYIPADFMKQVGDKGRVEKLEP